jgi:hypothetical protein
MIEVGRRRRLRMEAVAMAQFTCPSCKATLSAADGAEGRTVTCACGISLRVPSLPQDQAIPTATLLSVPRYRILPTTEQLLEEIVRYGPKRASVAARIVSVFGWSLCGLFLLLAWTSMRTPTGVNVLDVSYATLVALTGYVLARIIEKIATLV